jgi:hypothetical protein
LCRHAEEEMDKWIQIDCAMADDGGLFSKGTVGKGNLELNPQIKGNLKDWMKLAGIMTNSYADATGDAGDADMFFTGQQDDDDGGDEGEEERKSDK